MNAFDYIGIGFCSNDHLAVLPFIPMDTKVKMLSHAILGGGPAANSTAGAATLGLSAAACNMVGGYLGAGLVMKKGAKIVKPIILAVLGLLALKLAGLY